MGYRNELGLPSAFEGHCLLPAAFPMDVLLLSLCTDARKDMDLPWTVRGKKWARRKVHLGFIFRTAMGLYQTHFPSLNLPSLGMMRPLEWVISSPNSPWCRGKTNVTSRMRPLCCICLFSPRLHTTHQVAGSFSDTTSLSERLWWVLKILLPGPSFTLHFWDPSLSEVSFHSQ